MENRTFLKGLGSQVGSTIGILMVVLAGATFFSYSLYSMMQRLNTLNRDTTRQQIYEAAMTSLLNYTRAGVKRRWCFTPTWDPDSPLNCNLTHPYSSERLMISPDELQHIKDMIVLNPNFPHGDPIDLSSFDQIVDLNQLPADHPIRQILGGHEFGFAGKVHFTITRMTDKDLPPNGSQAYLKILVEILPKIGQSLPESRSQMIGWSKVVVYPREVGSFALIVPNDLRLDGSSGPNGDISFPPVGSTSAAAGITFTGPVFVNGNIFLPAIPAVAYTPVTFASQVTLGDGILMRGGQPAVTSQAGGYLNQTYSSIGGFGGFLGGISIDGERDPGLDCYDGKNNCKAPDPKLMNLCLARLALKRDLNITNNASLLVRTIGPLAWDLSWTSAMNSKYNVVDQDYFRSPQAPKGSMAFSGQWSSMPTISDQTNPVMSVDITMSNGQKITQVQMPRSASLVFSPKMSSQNNPPSGPPPSPPPSPPPPPPGPPAAPTITLTTTPFVNTTTGLPQDNRVELKININNPGNAYFSFDINLAGYDVSVFDGITSRCGTNCNPKNTFNQNMTLHINTQGGNVQVTPNFGGSWVRTDGQNPAPNTMVVNDDWEHLEQVCGFLNANPLNAFPASNWDVTFQMQSSWNLSPPVDPTGGTADFHSNTDTVANRVSIASLCDVHADANLVVGFFVCDTFFIESRSKPLKIVGTVITRKLIVDKGAYAAGVTWSNVYNSNSILDLRAAGILHPLLDAKGVPIQGGSCDTDPNNPIWNPSSTALQKMNAFLCNGINLRYSFNPITWTTVDPDCGLDPNNAAAFQTTCKNHPVRFMVLEYDRGFYL